MGEVIKKNISKEEALEIIKDFPVEFFSNRVLVTVNTEQGEELSLTDNVIAEEQYVIAAGNRAVSVEAGDTVILDLKKLLTKKAVAHDQYQFEETLDLEPFVYGDNTFALINDNQLKGRYKNV
jgi:hypothetical protein